jgi:hypothetical protein
MCQGGEKGKFYTNFLASSFSNVLNISILKVFFFICAHSYKDKKEYRKK